MPSSRSEQSRAPSRREIGLVELPAEMLLAVVADGRLLGRLSCSPFGRRELALGWLYAQGWIAAAGDVAALRLAGDRALVRLKPGAGRQPATPRHDRFVACSGGEASDPPPAALPRVSRGYDFTLERAAALMRRLPARAAWFRRHGGIHCAMLADMPSARILASREDIGRSNCLDKLVGWGLARGVDFAGCAVFTTGRVSAEMALKCLRAGIPALVSQTTLTDRALAIARASNLAIIGHVLKPRPIIINS